MSVERRWINWFMAISSALVLIIALAQAVICFYVNLTTNFIVRRQITASILTSLGVLTFPMTWLGFSATISRHKGVYIAVLVTAGLSFLDVVGMLAWPGLIFSQSTPFGNNGLTGFSDSEGGLSIAIIVLESLLVFLHFFVLGFAIAATASRPLAEKKPAYYQAAGAGYQPAGTGYQPAGAGYGGYYPPPNYPAISSDAYRLSSMPRGGDYPLYYTSSKPRY